jgi:hypothetical protein
MLEAVDAGTLSDPAAFAARVRSATKEIVQQQADAGVDIVNDGEQGKVGYSTLCAAAHRPLGWRARCSRPDCRLPRLPARAALDGTPGLQWPDRGK